MSRTSSENDYQMLASWAAVLLASNHRLLGLGDCSLCTSNGSLLNVFKIGRFVCFFFFFFCLVCSFVIDSSCSHTKGIKSLLMYFKYFFPSVSCFLSFKFVVVFVFWDLGAVKCVSE